MSALKIAQAIEQENMERAELRLMLSSVLTELKDIKGQLKFQKEDEEKLLGIKEVCLIVGFAHNWIYDQIKENNFPKPIKFGSASRWKKSEITIWMESQKSYRVN